jgi:hypothetical protein
MLLRRALVRDVVLSADEVHGALLGRTLAALGLEDADVDLLHQVGVAAVVDAAR